MGQQAPPSNKVLTGPAPKPAPVVNLPPQPGLGGLSALVKQQRAEAQAPQPEMEALPRPPLTEELPPALAALMQLLSARQR